MRSQITFDGKIISIHLLSRLDLVRETDIIGLLQIEFYLDIPVKYVWCDDSVNQFPTRPIDNIDDAFAASMV